MNPWALWLVTLLHDGNSIPAHGGGPWRAAIKAITTELYVTRTWLLLRACVDTSSVCTLCQYCHHSQGSELQGKRSCIHCKHSVTTKTHALRNMPLEHSTDNYAKIKYFHS